MRGSPNRSTRASSSLRVAVVTSLVGLALAAASASTGCGPDHVGVEACQRIEKVRCESAPACGIKLGRPLHSGDTAESDVAACTRYYDDQCLHGLALKQEPAQKDVDACVDAIINGDCSIVESPQTHPACAFLVPPAAAATVDAAADSSTAEANADGGDAAR
jgi:hypothetical protein